MRLTKDRKIARDLVFGATHCAACGKSWREHSSASRIDMGYSLRMTVVDGKVYASECEPAEIKDRLSVGGEQ